MSWGRHVSKHKYPTFFESPAHFLLISCFNTKIKIRKGGSRRKNARCGWRVCANSWQGYAGGVAGCTHSLDPLNYRAFRCSRYKSGVRSSAVRGSNVVGSGVGGGSGRLCELRRAYKAAVVPCKTGRRRARGMSMGQKVSGGVKAVNRDATAPYRPVIPRELAQVRIPGVFPKSGESSTCMATLHF